MIKRLAQDPAFTLLTWRGVQVQLQASFVILPLWAAGAGVLAGGEPGQGSLFMVTFVLLLYVCATVHELGHILLARRHGATITRVRVTGMGAYVQVNSPAGLTPRQDLIIALGGPLASALLSALMLTVAWPLYQAQGLAVFLHRDPQAMLVVLAGTNVLLTGFNLLPVFPMDGGRALNALLAGYMRPANAAQVVSVFGQVIAAVLALSVALLTGDTLLRFTAFVTAGLVFLVSHRAGRRALASHQV